LASGKVQFVEFFAYWCTVCKAMAPTVHGLENIYSADVSFVYLDRDDPATASFQEQLGYIYQPHFFLIDANGQILGEWRGYVEGEVLQQAIVASLQ
jgi:thiol-disulfide isomerase/thioredoxin